MERTACILVGVDFSPCSEVALMQAARLASRSNAELGVVHVLERPALESLALALGVRTERLESEWRDRADAALRMLVSKVGQLPRTRSMVAVGSPGAEIVRAAREVCAGLIVLGAYGRGHPGGGAGGVASRCVRTADADALLVHERHGGAFRQVVACTDFSAAAGRAFAEAVQIARQDGALLHVLHVYTPPQPEPPILANGAAVWPMPAGDFQTFADQFRDLAWRRLEEWLAPMESELTGLRVTRRIVEHSSPGAAICDYLRGCGADLAVLGTHGRADVIELVLGGTAERVLRHVPCSVLAVKPPGRSERP